MSELGPWGWENWQAMREGHPSRGGIEIACYTDAHMAGDRAEFGPYLLLNPRRDLGELVFQRLGAARLGLVLRLELHRRIDDPDDYLDADWDQTDHAVFHGGDAGQELASLVSLALGVRLRASGISREFDPDGDPRGYPHGFDEQVPYLPPPYRDLILPYTASDSARLDTCRQLLLAYPSLSAAQARALVRAARSYQEGLWMRTPTLGRHGCGSWAPSRRPRSSGIAIKDKWVVRPRNWVRPRSS